MLRGYYTISSGILQQERTINVLTNNIVNVDTPGFQASRVVSTTFEHELLTRIENNNNEFIGTGDPIRIMSEVPVNFESSSIEETERPYDMAINGEGFFVVQADGENYLTRNGNFDVDENGFLILRGKGQVMSVDNTPINVADSDFTVREDGVIFDENGIQISQISLVTVPAEEVMTVNTNGMYSAENPAAIEQVEIPNIVQGAIERSNIDMTQEYTLVMEAQRAFQACSTALQIIDEINRKSATQIAAL